MEEKPLSCLDCRHVTIGSPGICCTKFMEMIGFDDVAQECAEYAP